MSGTRLEYCTFPVGDEWHTPYVLYISCVKLPTSLRALLRICAVIGKCHCGGLEISGTRVRRDSVAAHVNVAQVCAGHALSQSQRLV